MSKKRMRSVPVQPEADRTAKARGVVWRRPRRQRWRKSRATTDSPVATEPMAMPSTAARKPSAPGASSCDKKEPLGAPFFLFNIVMCNVTYYNIGGGGL